MPAVLVVVVPSPLGVSVTVPSHPGRVTLVHVLVTIPVDASIAIEKSESTVSEVASARAL